MPLDIIYAHGHAATATFAYAPCLMLRYAAAFQRLSPDASFAMSPRRAFSVCQLLSFDYATMLILLIAIIISPLRRVIIVTPMFSPLMPLLSLISCCHFVIATIFRCRCRSLYCFIRIVTAILLLLRDDYATMRRVAAI